VDRAHPPDRARNAAIALVCGVGDAGSGSYLLHGVARAAIESVAVSTRSSLALTGWRGWSRAVDVRTQELLDLLDEVWSVIDQSNERARSLRDG